MGFNAGQFRRVSWTRALVLGVALQALPLAACSGDSGADVAQSGDTLKGGTPAGGKDKEKTDSGKHMGQAGAAAPGRGRDDAGVDEEKGNGGQGQGAAGSKGEQGQGKGKQEAGASGSESHGKSGQPHAGSHAQGPKAGHGADDDDMDDMDDEADETDETP
jgi:hypothetical protein